MILVPRYLSPMRVVKNKSSSSLSGGSPHKMSGSASPEKTPTKKSQSLAIFLNKGNDVWSCISLTFLKPIFSWPEPKAQVSFSDHNLWSPIFWRIWNFSLFICKYFNYCTAYQLKYIIKLSLSSWRKDQNNKKWYFSLHVRGVWKIQVLYDVCRNKRGNKEFAYPVSI